MTSPRWPRRAYVRLAGLCGGAGFLVGVTIWLVAPREYTSSSEIILESERRSQLSGALAALGSQFGLRQPDPSLRPHFIEALVTSRDVLTAVVLDSFPDPEDPAGGERSLVEILTDDKPDTPKRIAKGRKELDGSILTRVDTRTDIIEVEVELPGPELAQVVHSALLAETDRANRRIQQTQARYRRKFIEERLELARQRLLEAEKAQQKFHESNVRYQQSPELMLMERRLQRQVLSRQELYSSLQRDLEQALQDEARDVPSISIVTQPNLPWQKSWPSGSQLSLAGFTVGVGLATLMTFIAIRRPAAATDLTSPKVLFDEAVRSTRAWFRSFL